MQIKGIEAAKTIESPRNHLRRLPNLNTNFTKLHNRADCSLIFGSFVISGTNSVFNYIFF
ncbi:hypothetical protein M2451_002049 [Dysgonomonas sp. PFB1-18]|nr:hypothetical protein [Dysgonomonas sp. PF1-14]MDH6339225.1 hypothetical protein [Dysgonomonas sp. PF1-16]MDH6380724.1 hypothetical protein [Dysgonomonas sp. PFB1-18]MDH6398220.1 hypothetical protein [Dysgonomonas sp. PF1-23]